MTIVDYIIEMKQKNRLPVNIKRIFRADNITDIYDLYKFKLCGTYIISITNRANYVGSTSRFGRRMYEHRYKEKLHGVKNIKYISLVETEIIYDAMKLEDWLIYTCDPSLNVIGRKDGCCSMNDQEKLRLCKTVKNGEVRRYGLYDMIKNIQRYDMSK